MLLCRCRKIVKWVIHWMVNWMVVDMVERMSQCLRQWTKHESCACMHGRGHAGMHGMVWHGMVWCVAAWHGVASHGMTWHGQAWLSMAWHDMAYSGPASHRMAWRGMCTAIIQNYFRICVLSLVWTVCNQPVPPEQYSCLLHPKEV